MQQTKQHTELPLAERLKALPALFGIRFGEEPRFQVLVSDNSREVRRYVALTLASVCVPGNFSIASDEGYSRLFGYIFDTKGSPCVPLTTESSRYEEHQEAMAMTVPVLQQKGRRGWTLSFVLPQRLELEAAPRPKDPGITLEKMPARLVACIRFSGVVDQSIIDQKTSELRGWLDANRAFRAVGEPLCALYDSPHTIPFLRRNEIHIPVQVHR